MEGGHRPKPQLSLVIVISASSDLQWLKRKSKKEISREGNVGSPIPSLGSEAGVHHASFFFLC